MASVKARWLVLSPWVKLLSFAAFGLAFPLADVVTDFAAAAALIGDGHDKWGWMVAYFTFVPTIICLKVNN